MYFFVSIMKSPTFTSQPLYAMVIPSLKIGIRKAPGFLRVPTNYLLFIFFFRLCIGAEVVFLNKYQGADSLIPRCVHVLADSGAFPSVKSTLFAADYFVHAVFLHDLLLQRKSTYVSVDASQKFLCTILSKYGMITKVTVIANKARRRLL